MAGKEGFMYGIATAVDGNSVTVELGRTKVSAILAKTVSYWSCGAPECKVMHRSQETAWRCSARHMRKLNKKMPRQ